MTPEPPHHLRLIRLSANHLHSGLGFAIPAVGLPVGGDLDAPRLHRVRHFADKVDLKQAVCKGRALDLDMIGEAKSSLERPSGDALVDEFLVGALWVPPGNGQEILLRADGDVVGRKAGKRERYAIALLTGPRDVVGRITFLALQQLTVVDEIELVIEADGRFP
jgi:hypothetical protein